RDPASAENENLRRALVAAGATIHFPTIAIVRGETVIGNVIAGYKRAEGYMALLEPRLRSIEAGRARTVSGQEKPTGSPLAPRLSFDVGGAHGEATERSSEAEVVWTYPVRPAPGAFFRWVPGTRFISFDQRRKVWLVNVETDERVSGPGWIDFVPTPDGRLFVTPGNGHDGLEFYVASDVFRFGKSSEPVFVDNDMTDQYPSVGILEESQDGMRTRYRILISWFEGLAFRDYEVEWRGYRDASIRPVSPKREACSGMGLSTPIMSKDSREIAARDEATGTTKLFRLEDDASCTELFDFGRPTSKVGFSADGMLIAYSSPDPIHEGRTVRSTTYVLDRESMRTTAVPFSRSAGLVIPEFVGADSLLIAVKEEPGDHAVEFRLICCVRWAES
ncbi:MAG: hypothetical protein ACRELX_14595, partial [Longimicrobiales bacterium]